MPRPAFGLAPGVLGLLKAVMVVKTPVVRSLAMLPMERILGDTTAVMRDCTSLMGTGVGIFHWRFFSTLARSSWSRTRVLVSRKLSIFYNKNNSNTRTISKSLPNLQTFESTAGLLTPNTKPSTAFLASKVASGNFRLFRSKSTFTKPYKE